MRISPQTFTAEAQPTESLHTEVPENYGGNFPFYILKVSWSAGWLPITPKTMLLLPLSVQFSFLLWISFESCFLDTAWIQVSVFLALGRQV